MSELKPRIRATQILKLPEPERQAALNEIEDGQFKQMVSFYIRDHGQKVESMVRWVMGGKTRDARNKLLDAVPIGMRDEVKRRVERIFEGRKK